MSSGGKYVTIKVVESESSSKRGQKLIEKLLEECQSMFPESFLVLKGNRVGGHSSEWEWRKKAQNLRRSLSIFKN